MLRRGRQPHDSLTVLADPASVLSFTDRLSYARPMPLDASGTRLKLTDEAAKAFAEHGIYGASLIDITRRAGQHNRGALYYHFGSRTGVLRAVLERHVDFLSAREGELLEIAKQRPTDDIASVVEAIVRPATELADTGWRGRCFLIILCELVMEDPSSIEPEISEMLARTGGYDVYELLASRLAHIPTELRAERFALMTSFILRSVADRAKVLGRGRRSRPRLTNDAFVENLVSMIAAAINAAC
jgi:AcrR family transcriptional regulator